ncbi:fimbrial protein [Phocaeicola paurosaccharolyticus]|uniref:fimbrial protein n=1 Tax=Phocaeicola paurosaccharolyticus TaxID=732242 RepID=UPI00046AAA50|nr:fimbrial protein [Phocaeicola paurosaccharolyticus]
MKIMKRKKINLYGGAALITTALLLSSCIKDVEQADPGSGTSDKTLTLTINTGSTAENAGTRVTNITSDPKADDENKPEEKINRVTVGVFGSDNNVKIIKEFTSEALTGVTHNTATVTSASLASGDQVLVAVNAPSGRFSGVTTVSDFESKTMSIDESLATSDGILGEVEVPGNLPMFGTGSISDESGLKATVLVYHLVSKISLNSLSVAFDAYGAYSAATFTPTEVFLLNVPNKLTVSPVGSVATTYTGYSSPIGTVSDPWCHGAISDDGINTTTYSLKEYLGTGTFNPIATALNGDGTSPATATWGGANANKLFFYTMPNNNTTNNTRLVIKGDFVPKTGVLSTTYYYPVNINIGDNGLVVDGGNVKVVAPNINYQLGVIIKSIGVTDPTGTLDQNSVSVTATVKPFVDGSQTSTFN